jgi:hypothetical protein
MSQDHNTTIVPAQPGWFTKRYNQLLDFTLGYVKNKGSVEGLTERETWERVVVHDAIGTLVLSRHAEHLQRLKRMELPQLPEDREITGQLIHLLKMLDAAYDALLPRFGHPGLLHASDPLALTKAIYCNMKDFSFAEADADAAELRRFFAEEAA